MSAKIFVLGGHSMVALNQTKLVFR